MINEKKNKAENEFHDSTTNSQSLHISKRINQESYINLLMIKLKNLKLEAPFPRKLQMNEVINYYPKSKSEIFADFEIKDKEGAQCINDDINQRQSGIFAEIFTQFAKNLFRGGNISLSLPIRVFEPRSMLERFVDWFSFSPILLKKANQQNDPFEAFKHAIIFTLSGLFFSTNQLKPFNPFLGETFQGHFEDGTEVYLEHTSHNPCISHYYVNEKNNDFLFSGYIHLVLEGTFSMIATNSVKLLQKGKNTIYLKNTDQTIHFQFPKLHIGGMFMGKRTIYWDGHMKFEDRKNNLKAFICFAKSHSSLKHKRIHDFYGQILFNDFNKEKSKSSSFYEPSFSKDSYPKDKNLRLSEITGSWLENIAFDNKVYWNFTENIPIQIYPTNETLPSDSRYREDLIWLKRSCLYKENKKEYEEYSQKWKLLLEYQQRYERGLREKRLKESKK
jgi:hypothetical protein